MLKLFRKKKALIFNEEQNRVLVQAIQEAEKQTSGEIRIYIELKCRFVDARERAKELFFKLKMERTKERNGVLVYVALNDRQLAIIGDRGIHEKMGDVFWKKELLNMQAAFREKQYIKGIKETVLSIGQALKTHFPHQSDDQNELSDEIIYGS